LDVHSVIYCFSDQAAFVYSAAPDLFSYSVSKKTSIKLAKSETSLEFARRNFLMVKIIGFN
jgi:hypothetical protein